MSDEAVVEADDKIAGLIDALTEARAATAAAKAAEDEAREALLEAFNDLGAREFTVNGRKAAAMVLKRRTGIDQDVLRRLAPKALEKARKVTEHYALTLSR